jgi:Tfp pilus assembly protein PilX
MNNVYAKRPKQSAKLRSQTGSALIFLMILLLGVALLAFLANRSAIVESVASRSSRDYLIARNAAESAIADTVKAISTKNVATGVKAKEAIFDSGRSGDLVLQTGGCPLGGALAAGANNGTGNQKANGTGISGLVDFSACPQTKAWWQEITLTDFESLSAEVGANTGDTDITYVTVGTIPNTLAKSYKKPRVIIEPLQSTEAKGDASALGASSAGPGGAAQSTVFRITAVGYGPTRDSVVMLQETWRPQD